ncbi:MAG: HAD family phosphatase [Prevotellaceae bacterium]|jgi:putative hydrolase of the HAD superfamily|nr:HAD family phosphatase [Prevotellaceae bacterium]
MLNLQNINAIIFDLGGVLVDLDKERCVESFREIGIADTDKIIGVTTSTDVIFDLEVGKITREEFYMEMRHRSSLNPANEQIDAAWLSMFGGIPQAKTKMLEMFKTRYRLFLLSNTNPIHIEGLNRILVSENRKPIQNYFEKCFLSYEMKMAKPDKKIYQRVLNEIGEKAENCLFIDDGEKNISAAKKLGIVTYLVKEKEVFNFQQQ